MTLFGVVRASPDIVSQRLGDEIVLLNLKTGVYWGLNPTGAVIWEEIVKHGEVPRILTRLCNEFDASEQQLSAALRDLLAQLSREGLVHADGAGQQP